MKSDRNGVREAESETQSYHVLWRNDEKRKDNIHLIKTYHYIFFPHSILAPNVHIQHLFKHHFDLHTYRVYVFLSLSGTQSPVSGLLPSISFCMYISEAL